MTNPYTTVSISGYNSNPPSDDGTKTAQNEIAWAKHKDKLTDPLKDAIESINTNTNSAFGVFTTEVINPANATDSGTDAFQFDAGRDIDSNDRVVADFQSANTTTTPTLENTGGTPSGAKTIKTRDGSALWAGAINGIHTLEYDGTDMLLLDPIPQTDSGTDAIAQLDKFTAGHIDGLELSNGTDADHDIDIATGVCSMRDGSGNRKLFELTSTTTKQIDNDWSEGTDAGGFPSGLTLAADTWYHFFVIGKNDGSVDAGFDTSTSASNLLSDASNYSWFRRIGSVLTNSSSNINGFQQSGDIFWWDSVVLDVDGSNPSSSATSRTMSVPPDFKVRWLGHGHIFDDSVTAATAGLISDPDSTNVAPVDGGLGQLQLTGTGGEDEFGASYLAVMTNTSSEIRTRFSNTTADHSIRIATEGWIDPRGRNQ